MLQVDIRKNCEGLLACFENGSFTSVFFIQWSADRYRSVV